MKWWKNILASASVIILLLSCERRPLIEPDFKTRVEVKVNIETIANVTSDVYNEKIPLPKIEPEVMRVMFYNLHEDQMLGESFISNLQKDEHDQMIVSGEVSILPGEYRVMVYAFGTESTLISKYDSWNGCTAYTDALSQEYLKTLSLKSPLDEQPIHFQPDHLLAARSEYESIPWHSGSHVIHSVASSVVESYYLQVKVQGLEYVSSARAVMTSMSGSVPIATAQADYSSPVALYIPLQKSDDKGKPVICNIFHTFGRIPESTNELEVTFDLMTVDGRTVTKSFDISDLFLSQDCIEHHWLLVEETIVVPPPPDPGPGTSGGGFDPVVDDWENENHEIEM